AATSAFAPYRPARKLNQVGEVPGTEVAGPMLQLAEQRLRLLQVARVKPLSAPAVNRSKELATLLPLALMVPEPRHAHCRWEFPELSLLLTGDSRLAYRT